MLFPYVPAQKSYSFSGEKLSATQLDNDEDLMKVNVALFVNISQVNRSTFGAEIYRAANTFVIPSYYRLSYSEESIRQLHSICTISILCV